MRPVCCKGADTLDEVQLVICRVDNEEYALDINDVKEIIRLVNITRVPYGPDCLRGVINLRGQVIPVMDMSKRLNLSKLTLSDLSRIVVVSSGEITAGLLVDEVSEVLRLPCSYINSQSVFTSGESGSLFAATGEFRGRVLLVLNLDSIFEMNNCWGAS